jgi:hypothetical protein
MFYFKSFGTLNREPVSIDTPSYANNIGTKIDHSFEYYKSLLSHTNFQKPKRNKNLTQNEYISFFPISLYPFYYNKYKNVDLQGYIQSKSRLKVTFNQIDFRHDPHHLLGCDNPVVCNSIVNNRLISRLSIDTQRAYNSMLQGNSIKARSKPVIDYEWLNKQNTQHSSGYVLIYSRVCNHLFSSIGEKNDIPEIKTHFIDDFGYGGYHIPDDQVIRESDISNNRSNDCLITGQMIPHIYPFRVISLSLLNKCDDIKKKGLSKEYLGLQNEIKENLSKVHKGDLPIDKFQLASEGQMKKHKDDFIEAIRNSKTAIGCSSVFGYPLKKYFECMANGCVVVGQMPTNKEELGFKHMVNVYECSVDEVPDAIRFLCKNDDIRTQLAKNARELILNKYTMSKAADKTIAQFNRILSYYN